MKSIKTEKFSQFENQQEGLWVSPLGKMIPVTEHLQTISQYPEKFNLDRSEVPRDNNIEELRSIAEKLIQQGWIRVRPFELQFTIEVYDINSSRPTLNRVLKKLSTIPEFERVNITEHLTNSSFDSTVNDFMKMRQLSKVAKNSWAFIR